MRRCDNPNSERTQGPIASIFWQNEEFATGLGRDICLDGVVCVVDAVFGKKVAFSPVVIDLFD